MLDRRPIIILIAGLLILAVLFMRGAWKNEVEELDGPQAPVTSTRVLPISWQPGSTRAYDLEMATEVMLRLDHSTTEVPIEEELVGTLLLRVLDVSSSKIQTAFLFALATEENQGVALTPFLATFERSGRPVAFQFRNAGADDLSQRQIRNAIRAVQLVQGKDPAQPSWQVDELDGTGHHRASYVLADDGRSVTKSKHDYVRTSASEDDLNSPFPDPEVRILQSTNRLAWSSEGSWLDHATIKQEIEIRSSLGQWVRVRIEGALRPRSTPRALLRFLPNSTTDFLAMTALSPRSEEEGPAPGNREPETLTAEQRGEFVRQMDELIACDSPSPDQLEQLAELIRRYPDLAAEIGLGLAQDGLHARQTAVLMLVLRMADTDAAARQLGLVIDGPSFARSMRGQAIRAAARLEASGAQLVDSLWRVARSEEEEDDQLAMGATLALGAIARGMTDDPDAPAATLRAAILGELARASEPERQALVLTAIANMRSPEARDAVIEALGSDSILVRSAAAHALPATVPSEAGPILIHALSSEESAPVRAAMVAGLEALQVVAEDTLWAIDRQVAREQDSTVRTAMARFLAKHIDGFPRARETLINLVREDRDSGVRRAAARALARRR